MKTIVFAESASRAFDKLPADVQERLVNMLFRYGATGRGDVKRLQGIDAMRLRIGDYRIGFRESATALEIAFVGDRKDVYG